MSWDGHFGEGDCPHSRCCILCCPICRARWNTEHPVETTGYDYPCA